MTVLTFKRTLEIVVLVLGITLSESFSFKSFRAPSGRLSLALPSKTTQGTQLLTSRRKNDHSYLGNGLQLLNPLTNVSESNIRPRLRLLRGAWLQIRSRAKKALRTVVMFYLLLVLCISQHAAAVPSSAGRMGGSFRPSSSISAPSHKGIHGPLRDGPLPPTGLYMRANALPEIEEFPGTLVQQPSSPSGKAVKVVDPLTYYCALTGIYGLGIYRIKRSGAGKSDGSVSALGSGASVLRLSVALDVSNRDDKDSILSRLRRISADAETSSRRGLQELVSEVALEVLRQRDTITAACSSYMHCSGTSHADIEFKRMSTHERAKFGKETVNVFNGVKVIEPADESTADTSSQATSAIVSILVSIEGDRTNIPTIVSRRDLENALLRIAADSQVEECLLQAEVLWSPEDKTTYLSNRDIAESYPELAVI